MMGDSKEQVIEEEMEGEEENEPDSPITEKDIFRWMLVEALNTAMTKPFSKPGREDERSEGSSSRDESSEEEVPSPPGSSSAGSPETYAEYLLRLSPRQYILRTVGEALLFALDRLNRARPSNPIEFIAEYILRYREEEFQEDARKEEYESSTDLFAYHRQILAKNRF